MRVQSDWKEKEKYVFRQMDGQAVLFRLYGNRTEYVSRVLLDTSALLAILLHEPGGPLAAELIAEHPCAVSSVTLTELEGKLVGRGEYTHGQVRQNLRPLLALLREVAFDANCREHAAFYYARKAPYKLSLGDAACLGTAEALSLSVITAERNCKTLPDLPFGVTLIR